MRQFQRLTLAGWMKARRIATVDVLADRIRKKTDRAVSRATLYRLLNNDTKPQHETVTAVEQALGLEPGQLVVGKAKAA